jgi:Zinc finger, C2H2 type
VLSNWCYRSKNVEIRKKEKKRWYKILTHTMASKRRSRTVEILPLRTTRRAAATKSSRQVKKPEDTKIISALPKTKNVIREIEKPKLSTNKKPLEPKNVYSKQLKQKKVHKCGICNKVFKGLNDLRKHLRIHSDERPYECPEKGCGKRFRQAGCLKNHKASQHPTTADIRYSCDVRMFK